MTDKLQQIRGKANTEGDNSEVLGDTLEIAGLGPRFLAYLTDTFLLFIVLSVIVIPVGLTVDLLVDRDAFFAFFMILLSYLIQCGYFAGFWTKTGQTPGKMVMGIRVISVDASPVPWGRAILRYVGYIVSSFLALGFIWAAFDSKRQGWHDKIAGTYVVRVNPGDTAERRDRSGFAVDVWAALIAAGAGVLITVILSILQHYAAHLSEVAFERGQVSKGLATSSLTMFCFSPVMPLANTLLIGGLAGLLMEPPRSEKGGAVTGALATFIAMFLVVCGSILIDSLINPYAPTIGLIVSREIPFSGITYDVLCFSTSLFCGSLAGAIIGRALPGRFKKESSS